MPPPPSSTPEDFVAQVTGPRRRGEVRGSVPEALDALRALEEHDLALVRKLRRIKWWYLATALATIVPLWWAWRWIFHSGSPDLMRRLLSGRWMHDEALGFATAIAFAFWVPIFAGYYLSRSFDDLPDELREVVLPTLHALSVDVPRKARVRAIIDLSQFGKGAGRDGTEPWALLRMPLADGCELTLRFHDGLRRRGHRKSYKVKYWRRCSLRVELVVPRAAFDVDEDQVRQLEKAPEPVPAPLGITRQASAKAALRPLGPDHVQLRLVLREKQKTRGGLTVWPFGTAEALEAVFALCAARRPAPAS